VLSFSPGCRPVKTRFESTAGAARHIPEGAVGPRHKRWVALCREHKRDTEVGAGRPVVRPMRYLLTALSAPPARPYWEPRAATAFLSSSPRSSRQSASELSMAALVPGVSEPGSDRSQQIRSRRLAFNRGVTIADAFVVATPLLARDGRLIAAIRWAQVQARPPRSPLLVQLGVTALAPYRFGRVDALKHRPSSVSRRWVRDRQRVRAERSTEAFALAAAAHLHRVAGRATGPCIATELGSTHRRDLPPFTGLRGEVPAWL
jgi:hypothetical protein